MCAVALGRADLWSNPEFRQFREGFDIVLTNPNQDLYSLIGVSAFSQFLNDFMLIRCLSSKPDHRSQTEWENSSWSSVTVGSSNPVRSWNFAHSHTSPPGQPLPRTANVPKHSKGVSVATFSEVAHRKPLWDSTRRSLPIPLSRQRSSVVLSSLRRSPRMWTCLQTPTIGSR